MLCQIRSMLDLHHEDCGEATTIQYSVANLRVRFGRAKRNVGAGADPRGPGRVPGHYATESAMNELADQLKIDPVKLRVVNEPKIDESLGVPSARRSSAGPCSLLWAGQGVLFDNLLRAPTTDGREIRLRRITEPTTEQKFLLHQLGLELPERFQLNRKCSVDPAVA